MNRVLHCVAFRSAAVLIWLAHGTAASAAIVYWEGDTGTAWTAGANWESGNSPVSDNTTDIAGFRLAAYTGQPVLDLARSVSGLRVEATSGAVTASGNGLTLGGSGVFVASGSGGLTINNSVTLGATQTWTNNASGPLVVGGGVVVGTGDLTLTGNGDFTFSQNLGGGSGGLVMTSRGTLLLNGTQKALTGALTLSAGTTVLDFSASATNVVTSGTLNLKGGTLRLLGVPGTASSQTFSTFAPQAGASHIVLDNNGGASTTLGLTLGTRAAGGTVDFAAVPGSTLGTDAIVNLDAPLVNGIIGGWATVGSDWATKVGDTGAGSVTAYTGYNTSLDTSTWLPTHNISLNGTATTSSLSSTFNSLRLTGDSNLTLTNAITLTSGGILVTGSSTIGTTITGGTISPGNGTDLIITQLDVTHPLTIITNSGGSTNTSLTKSGPGKLILGGTWVAGYTGNTYINEGAVELNKAYGNTTAVSGTVTVGDGNHDALLKLTGGSTSEIPDSSAMIIRPGGVFDFNGKNEGIGNLTLQGNRGACGRVINTGATGGALTTGVGTTLTFNGGGSVDTGIYGYLAVGGPEIRYYAATNGDKATVAGALQFSLPRRITIDDDPYLPYEMEISGRVGMSEAKLGKAGAGALILSGTNNLHGGLFVNAGTLRATSVGAIGGTLAKIYFSAANGSTNLELATTDGTTIEGAVTIYNGTSAVVKSDRPTIGAGVTYQFNSLAMNSSALIVDRGANVTGGVAGVAFGGTTFKDGYNTLTVSAGSVVALGGLVRNNNAVANFAMSGAITTTSGSAGSILGGYLTLNGSSFAAVDASGNVGDFASYVNAFAPGANTDMTGDLPASGATGSLRFANAAPRILSLADAANIASGGILVAAGVGANGSTITGGTLTSGNGTDLIVHQYNVAGGLTITSAITGDIGLTKVGGGTLTLAAANDYTGPTRVLAGKLVAAPGAIGHGALIVGQGSPIVVGGAANMAVLDLSGASASVSSLAVQNTEGTATVTIGSGQTLTVNGRTTIGVPAPDNYSANNTTAVFNGGGNLIVEASTELFEISPTGTTGDSLGGMNRATADFTALASMSVSAKEFRVGVSQKYALGTARLAPTSKIDADVIAVGVDQDETGSYLYLGSRANTLWTNKIYVGSDYTSGGTAFGGRPVGSLLFGGSTGSIVIRGKNGTGRADLAIGVTMSTATVNIVDTFDVSGHPADLLLGTVEVGNRSASIGNGLTATFKFDQGLLDVNYFIAGVRATDAGGSNDLVGTVTLGNSSTGSGGIVTIGSNAGASVTLGSLSGSTSHKVLGVLNLYGGLTSLAGDIVKGHFGGVATVNLAGGVLDMKGHNIGSSGKPIDNLTFTSGILRNVASINGTGGFTKTGNGLLILSGTNGYSGVTGVAAGVLSVDSPAALGTTSGVALGLGTTTGTFRYTGAALNLAALLTMPGTTGGGAIESAGSGALNLSNGGWVETGAGAKTLTLAGVNTADNTLAAVVWDNLNATSYKTSLTKTGRGKWILTGTSAYTGTTTVDGGTLVIDTTASLANETPLTVSGGTLLYRGLNGAARAQTFAGATVAAGSSAVAVDNNGGSSTTVNLGAISRSAGGVVDFSAASGTLGTTALVQTSTALSNGILGGWATVGGDWATKDGSNNIVALASGAYETSGTQANWAATENVSLAVNPAASVTSATINSLRMTGGDTFTIASSNTLTIASGGLLVNSGAAYTLTGGTLKGSGSGGKDLVVINAGSGPLTIASVIADNAAGSSLTKAGSGKTTLTVANTYTGQTYVNGGTLSVSANNQLGAPATGATINVNGGTVAATATFALDNAGANKRNIVLGGNDGTIDVAAGSTLTVSGVVSSAAASAVGSAGGLVKTGSGSLKLSGNNTFAGYTYLSAGTLSIGAATGLGNTAGLIFSGAATLETTASLTLNAAVSLRATGTLAPTTGTLTIHRAIDGTGGLTKAGAGTVLLGGVNSYSGDTAITAGALQITNGYALGTSSTVTIDSGARLALLSFATLPSTTTIKVLGNGGDYFGSLRADTSPATVSGQIILRTGSASDAAGTRLGATNGGVLNVTGPIAAESPAQKSSLVVRTDDSLGAAVVLSGSNAYTGDTYALVGRLQLAGADNRLPVTTVLHVGNSQNQATATFDLGGVNQEVAGLKSETTATGMSMTVTNSSTTTSTLTVRNPSASYSYDGVVSGNLAITKAGGGTLALNGSNSYSGTTTVAAGTLLVNGVHGTSAAPAGDYVVATGATLAGRGTLRLGDGGDVLVSGRLSPGSGAGSAGVLTLEFAPGGSRRLDFAGGSQLDFDLGASSDLLHFALSGDFLSGGANATLNLILGAGFDYGGRYTIFDNVGSSPGAFQFGNIVGYDTASYQADLVYSATSSGSYGVVFTNVPEPSTYAMLLGGSLVAGTMWWRRRRRADTATRRCMDS